MTCPGCNGDVKHTHRYTSGALLGSCSRCGGLVGEDFTYKEIRDLLRLELHPNPDSVKNPRYFDFSYTQPDMEPARVHGWFDPETLLVTQFG